MISRMISILVLLTLPAQANAQPGFGGDNPVTVSATPSTTTVQPGGTLVIAVTLDHDDGFHTWPNEPVLPEELGDFPATATEIGITDPADLAAAGIIVGPIQWPGTHTVQVRFLGPPIDLQTYDGAATAYIPIRIADDAPLADITLTIEAFYQACDDITCFPPTADEQSVAITIAESAAPPVQSELFDGFDPAAFESMDGVPSTPNTEQPIQESSNAGTSTQTFFGIPLPGGGAAGLLILALLGAAGGLILNLTPCVLPVIPIKVMTLGQHAGENRLRAAVLGFWMALGVVAFWAALAIPVLTLQNFTDPSRIFGIWWLTTTIGVLIALMSFGLMGMFSITLPQKTYMFNPKADSPSGSFMFGIMTAILGLPCFGFVAGALVPAAITQGTAFVVVLFTSMGVGMALPYLVLSIFPQLLSKLPKTGPASDLVKQIMGLLLLAAAAYFIGSGLIALVASKPYLAKLLHIWVAAFFGIAAGLLLIVRTFMITKNPLNRFVFGLIALAVAALGLLVATSFTADAREEHELRQEALAGAAGQGILLTTTWNDYSPALMDRALEDGFVVILDFTAEWCINCKVLEKTVLGVDPVKPLLQADDTVMIKVDLTGKNPEGSAALAALGRTGIPTLAIFGPGLKEPWIANAYTPEQVADAINRAKGK